MLVLKRSTGESVVIPLPDVRSITITVTDIGNGQTVLGFDAPKEVQIWRSEVMARQGFDPTHNHKEHQ